MSARKWSRNLSIAWVATIVLGGFSDAVAQVRYHVEDLGTLEEGFFGCTMGVNNHGLTETQYGLLEGGKLVEGRVAINFDGSTFPIPTLGGQNNWDNPFGGEVNDRGEAVGYSETDVLDPNGEDVCGFGTHLTCRAFLWRKGQMSALPTLGGNNAQASAMNNRGQITGFAENGTVDSSCSANATNNRIQLPVIWEDGKARALPTVGRDPDGVANAINDQGQAVGSSGNCAGGLHAVLWEKNGTASSLEPAGAAAFGINNQGQIVGLVPINGGATFSAALWQNGVVKILGTLGDHAAIASGINDKGQVVGSTLDSSFNFDAHAFIWQDGVMTDLSKLFPEESNLFPTMANQINDRGQIVGMATVLSGPHEGETHAFLATPVEEREGRSVADAAPEHPKSNLPANAGKQLLQRLGGGRLDQ